MLDQLEDRAAELEADNHALHRRVANLESERNELTDTLHAARAMNRELINQLNRETAPPIATNNRQRPAVRRPK
jgi:peptidoglycan hydrolase CwlO-like protein